MFDVSDLLSCSNADYRLVAPGCLAHPDDTVASSLLNVLAMLKQKVCETILPF